MNEELLREAEAFIRSSYMELGKSKSAATDRLVGIKQEIIACGTYEHTYEELEHGAKVAWRNSNRCIGRLFWDRLNVMDARNAKDGRAVFHALVDHR